jgi:uncharacterized membrane protein YdjX (TVP38/TMEM64 family)
MGKTTRVTVVIIVSLLLPLVPFLLIGELPGERWLSATDDNALLFGLSGSGLLALDILLPVPSSLIGTALGARLGFFFGILSCWSGLMLGTLIGYCVGHLLPAKFATHLPRTPSLALVFISRPIPVLAEAAAIAAGAYRLPFHGFVVASSLGNAVYSLALCASAVLWLPNGLAGPGLVVPLLLPVAGWLWWQTKHQEQTGGD